MYILARLREEHGPIPGNPALLLAVTNGRPQRISRLGAWIASCVAFSLLILNADCSHGPIIYGYQLSPLSRLGPKADRFTAGFKVSSTQANPHRADLKTSSAQKLSECPSLEHHISCRLCPSQKYRTDGSACAWDRGRHSGSS